MKKYTVHIVWAIIAVVALVGGFMYGTSGTSGARTFAGNSASSTARGGFAGRGGSLSGGFATGQVTSIDSTSITLQLANGNSEVVFYSGSTTVSEPTTVPISKIAPGVRVTIGGTTNSDGSLTAQTIQVASSNGTPRGLGGGAGPLSSSTAQ